MKLFKNKKGSQLVEKVLMVAFSVATGGAVIVYGTNVINASKNVNVNLDGVVAESSTGLQFKVGHKYSFSSELPFSEIANSEDNDMEYFSVNHIWHSNGQELLISGTYSSIDGKPHRGFLGYNCYCIDWDQTPSPFYLSKEDCDTACFSFDFTAETFNELTGRDYYSTPVTGGDFPKLNQNGFWSCFNTVTGLTFEFSGQYVRSGNGVHLLDYLVEVEE